MRERIKIEEQIANFVTRIETSDLPVNMSDALTTILIEATLDCRDLLVEIAKKNKRGIKVIEMGLTEKEEKLLNGLEEH